MHETCNGVDRWRIAEHILRHARNGVYSVVISAATLAEVHKPRGGALLTKQQDDQVLSFFEHEFIQIVDVDRMLGEHANRLCQKLHINPFDAIHVASAIRAGCDYLLTWDNKLLQCGTTEIAIVEPEMRGQHFLELAEMPEKDTESA